MSDMDFNDLSILFDDEDVSEKKDEDKNKKKNNWAIPVGIVAIIGLVIGVAAVSSGGGGEKKEETVAESTTPEVPKDLQVDLVNLQQVAWADKTCTLVKDLGENRLELKPTGNETNPVKARKFISWDISRNLKRLDDISDDFSQLPETSLARAQQDEKKTMPGDNNLKVGNEVDGNISTASRGIASAFEGYASALESLQSSLNNIASYNFNGIRDGIENTNGEINNLNGQLSQAISQNFSEDTFDNVATLQAVSELESCGTMMIDKDSLKKEKGEELEKSNKVRNIVSVRRCKSYLDNTSQDSKDESIKERRSSCEDVVSSVVLDPNDPYTKAQIDMQEDKRIIPQGESGSTESSTSSSSVSTSSKNTSTTTSTTSVDKKNNKKKK